MSTLISAGNSTQAIPLEIFWIQEDENGIVSFVSPDGEQFACNSRACAPPPVGTGGSENGPGGPSSRGSQVSTSLSPKGNYIGKAEQASDEAIIRGRSGGGVRSDGILEEPWINEDGKVTLSDKDIATAQKALNKMGTSLETWEANFGQVASRSMDADAEQAIRDSKWYQHEHETWGAPLAKEMGVTVDQVMGIASATSTNKTWDGVKSSNKEVTATILKYLKDDIKITITQEDADSYNQFSIDKPKGGGKYGPKSIEPGEYHASELSSGVLARTLGSGYNIGGQYFTDGLYKAFAVARGEIAPNDAIGSLKQRSFVNNLVYPDKDYSFTNDFWMTRAAFGSSTLNITKGKAQGEMTIKEWESATGQQPNSFLGTKGKGTGNLFAGMTYAAKNSLASLKLTDKRFEGMLTHEYQALIWVQMQREWGDYT